MIPRQPITPQMTMPCNLDLRNMELNKIYNQDALQFLQGLPSDIADAIVTDPPYSSGGKYKADKAKSVNDKYLNNDDYEGFYGDAKDQRSWTTWMTNCLYEAFRVSKPTSYLLCFIDWRMLPAMTDAVQGANWTWRGVAVWDKGAAARLPHTGYFRHQTEFIVWATKGDCLPVDYLNGSCMSGVIKAPVRHADKEHPTQKPDELMDYLVKIVKPGGLIIDPFCGAGTTLLAAEKSGRTWLGCDMSSFYCDVAQKRIANHTAQGMLAL